MRIVMIYDFGVNLGGGDFVMLNILEALCNAGYEVSLVTSHPKGLWESAKFFEKQVPNVDIHFIKVPSYLRHPYTIAYIAHKATKIRGNTNCVYLVSDDIPKCIANQKGVCYMNYPHATRFKFKEYIATKYKTTLRGKLTWIIHKTLFPRLYVVDGKPEKWLLIANSMITRQHAAETFHVNVENIVLLNPPVASRAINEIRKNNSSKKENLIVCVGRFELEKRFTEVLHALACLKKKINIKLSLIGFAYDEKHILKITRALGLEENVELLVNAERKALIDRLLRAKAVVHPTPYEPFGIAVVEGMAAGCVPIVKRGINGPWLEITEEGKYSLGFNKLEELTGAIEKVVKFHDSFDVETIVARALEFDEAEFKQKFINMFENFLVT
jgi:glycosyltransferase involved in cell wall biosynthesis